MMIKPGEEIHLGAGSGSASSTLSSSTRRASRRSFGLLQVETA
jgi:hypothetical protein